MGVTVTNADGQSGTLANAFTYATPTTITFVQVAAATPQSPTATVAVAFPAAQTPGDLNVVAVGTNDATSAVQSVQDNAGNAYLLAAGPTTEHRPAAIDLLREEHRGRRHRRHRDVQPGSVMTPTCAFSSIAG